MPEGRRTGYVIVDSYRKTITPATEEMLDERSRLESSSRRFVRETDMLIDRLLRQGFRYVKQNPAQRGWEKPYLVVVSPIGRSVSEYYWFSSFDKAKELFDSLDVTVLNRAVALYYNGSLIDEKTYSGARRRNPLTRFERLKRQLAARGVSDPAALAAWIGRRKYGKEKFQEMAARGRRRAANPADAAKVVARELARLPIYHETIASINDAIDSVLAKHGIQLMHWIDQAVPYGQSRQFLLETSDPGLVIAVQIHRMPSGRYELTSYGSRVPKRQRR